MIKNHQNTQSNSINSRSSFHSRWLITGGCGFIGLNLVKNLMEEDGHHIRIVDNLSVGSREDLSQVFRFTEIDPKTLISSPSVFSPKTQEHSSPPTTVELIVADILDAELALKAADGIDIIVHLAANTGVAPSVEDPRSDCMNNVIGTLNYLEAARWKKVKRFIFASSGAPVGECEPPIHEEVAPHPVSPYGASKLSGEAYCSAYFKTFGVETVVLRFGNVYGPLSSHKNSVVARFIKRAMEGKSLEIYGDGKQTRDFIFVDDLIRAIILSSISEEVRGEVFQIATNMETSITKLAGKIASIIAEYGYKDLKVDHTSLRIGEVKRNFSDTSKAKKQLNWKNEVDLVKGLHKTINWFIKRDP